MCLQTLQISQTNAPDASVIWLHGLGANGHDFEPVVEALDLTHIRFILPHAPLRAVTLNNGHEMPAWYDIFTLERDGPQDEAGIRAMQIEIAALIATENARGIPTQRIVLAGFSQGGAMALFTSLRFPERLAGIIGLSTYLPLRQQLNSERLAANQDTPIFLAHGDSDQIIPITTGQRVADLLADLNYQVEWHEYAMSHSVCTAEVQDIRNFLVRVLT